MYTGTLIDELMTAVERAERRAYQQANTAEIEHWYVLAPNQLASDQPFLGVA
jgi:hypothetical protein